MFIIIIYYSVVIPLNLPSLIFHYTVPNFSITYLNGEPLQPGSNLQQTNIMFFPLETH
jgi:hypothetical protein